MASEASRFVPVRRRDLLPRLLQEREDDEAFQHAARLLDHVLQFESERRSAPVRALYGPFDPDPLAAPLVEEDEDPTRFLAALGEVLEEANFDRLSDDDLCLAFEQKSLFPLLAKVDLDDYTVLRLYHRGTGHRDERVRGWSTLWRWRDRDVAYYERLVVVLQLRAEVLDRGRRTFRMVGMQPGRIYLKSFKNVPRADVEMVLPNTRLRMRPFDRALVGVPLAGGVLWTIIQSIGVITTVVGGSIALSLDDPRLRAIGGVLLVLGGYLWRSHTKVKTTRLQYLKTLSEGLYFRNLANNAAVIEQLVAMADAEEAKEALLAYHFLSRDGPMTADALDRKAEEWVRETTGRDADFDVQDGLACLEGLGLARRDEATWHAVDASDAARILDERWDGAFDARPRPGKGGTVAATPPDA